MRGVYLGVLRLPGVEAVSPLRLGDVAGRIGSADHVLGITPRGIHHHHADAGPDPEPLLGTGDIAVAIDCIADLLRDPLGLLVRAVLQQHHELVAAEARHDIVAAHRGSQQAGDLAKQFVARIVAAGIVDDLEMIQVDEHHRAALAVVLDAPHEACKPLLELEAVRQAGERIVTRLVGNLPRQLA